MERPISVTVTFRRKSERFPSETSFPRKSTTIILRFKYLTLFFREICQISRKFPRSDKNKNTSFLNEILATCQILKSNFPRQNCWSPPPYPCLCCSHLFSSCVCLCVFFPFILDIKFVGRTSRGHTDRRKVTQDFSSTFFLRCVPSFFSREGFSHSFPSSTVKSNFVILNENDNFETP